MRHWQGASIEVWFGGAGDAAPLPIAGSRSVAASRPMAVRGTPTSFKVGPLLKHACLLCHNELHSCTRGTKCKVFGAVICLSGQCPLV